MAGPGGKSVGRVSVRVVPDTDRFPKELRAKLEKIRDNVKLTLDVDLDDKALQKEAEAAAKKASGEKVKFKAELDAGGVTRETRRAKNVAEKATGKISLVAGVNFKASLVKIAADLKLIQAAAKAYDIKIPVDLVGLGKGLLVAGALSSVLLSIPHIVAGIGGAVQVVAGLLATLPAIAAASAAGIAAIVIGLHGMGKALSAAGDPKAFAEALKELPPSAQAAAKALATFREPLHDIRMSVQQKLFEGMADPLLSLKKLLPPIKSGLSGIAGGIKDMGIEWIKMATSQKSVKDTGVILGLTQSALENARPALANFGQALKDIAVVGASFLPKMGLGVSRISDRFATWAANARETGKMQEWISNAWEKLKQFGRILRDIVAIFKDFSAGLRGGKDLGDIIEGWTQSLRALLESAKGQSALKSLGEILREIAHVAGTVFKAAFNAVSDILRAAGPFLKEFVKDLGVALVGAIHVLTPLLRGLFKWLSDNKAIMAPLAVAIVGVVTAFKLFSTVAGLLETVWKGLRGIWGAAKLVWDGIGLLGKGFKLLLNTADWVFTWSKVVIGSYVKVAAAAVANAAKTAAAWIGQMARTAAIVIEIVIRQTVALVAQWVKAAAAAALQAGIVAAAWISQMTKMAVTTIEKMVVTAAAWVANWIRMAAVALAQAARMAAAWLIAMGPVAIVIAVVVGLVALIILNWDTIKDFTVKVFTAIWDFIVFIFNTVKDAIITAWNAVIDFFKKIPGWIGSALSTVWDVITWPFKKAWDFVTGLWDDISGFFSKIAGWIGSALSKVGDIIAAPFKAGWNVIQKIIGWIKDAIDWISDTIGSVIDWIGGLFSDQLELAIASDFSVPVTFGEFDAPFIPSVGFETYDAAGLPPGVNNLGLAMASVDRAGRNLTRSASDLGKDRADNGSIADQIAEALSGWEVVIDPRGVAKLARKGNTLNARR